MSMVCRLNNATVTCRTKENGPLEVIKGHWRSKDVTRGQEPWKLSMTLTNANFAYNLIYGVA